MIKAKERKQEESNMNEWKKQKKNKIRINKKKGLTNEWNEKGKKRMNETGLWMKEKKERRASRWDKKDQ